MNDRYSSVPSQGGMNEMDRERQAALDTITSAFALGKISLEDYEVRAEKIQRAIALNDIVGQTADLPPQELPREPERGTRAAANARGVPNSRMGAASLRRQAPLPAEDLFIEERNGTPEFSLCVMGDRKLAGDWLNSDQATSFTLMGSTTLDLSNTALPLPDASRSTPSPSWAKSGSSCPAGCRSKCRPFPSWAKPMCIPRWSSASTGACLGWTYRVWPSWAPSR